MDKEQKKNRRRKIVRYISLALFIIIISCITIKIYPYVKGLDFKKPEDREKLLAIFDRFDTFWSIIVFILLQAVQVVIAVIPPIQIVGGMMFGWFFGAIFSFAGIMLGTLVIFVLVRFLGRPIVETFVSNKHLEKFGFLNNEEKLIKVLIVLYVIPGVPKDILSYIVPLTKIKRRDFFMYVMPFRIPAVLLSTLFGQSVMTGSYVLMIVLICVFVLIALLGFLFRDKIIAGVKTHKSEKIKEENEEV